MHTRPSRVWTSEGTQQSDTRTIFGLWQYAVSWWLSDQLKAYSHGGPLKNESIIVFSPFCALTLRFLIVTYFETASYVRSTRLLLGTAVPRSVIIPFSSRIIPLWYSWSSWRWGVNLSYGRENAKRGTGNSWNLFGIERSSVSEVFEGCYLDGGVILTGPYFSVCRCREAIKKGAFPYLCRLINAVER